MGGLTNTPSLNLPKRWYSWAFFEYNDLHPKSLLRGTVLGDFVGSKAV